MKFSFEQYPKQNSQIKFLMKFPEDIFTCQISQDHDFFTVLLSMFFIKF